MGKYRTGYRFAWKQCSSYMKSVGLRKPGTYDPYNQHGGVMFSMPRDLTLTDRQAGQIMRKSYKKGATKSQLDNVRKMLAYAFQLTTGKDSSHRKSDPTNYERVTRAWRNMHPSKIKAKTRTTKAEISPEPKNLKKCFTTEYDHRKGMGFGKWVVGCLATWDSHVCGARSVADLEKIKKSVKHVFAPSAGWMSTELLGGRSKLEFRKKGIRPWKNYRVCLCPGGEHKPIPTNWTDHMTETFDPTKACWCTSCPLNCFQFVRDGLHKDDLRTYPRIGDSGLFTAENYSEDALKELIQEWINIQGGNPDGLVFSSNGGRKSCGKMSSEYKIPFHRNFELTGDLWCTWKNFYQIDLKRDPHFTRREQSLDPEECCAALWMIARRWGRGRPVRDDPVPMRRVEKMMALIGRKLGLGDEIAALLTEDDDPYLAAPKSKN